MTPLILAFIITPAFVAAVLPWIVAAAAALPAGWSAAFFVNTFNAVFKDKRLRAAALTLVQWANQNPEMKSKTNEQKLEAVVVNLMVDHGLDRTRATQIVESVINETKTGVNAIATLAPMEGISLPTPPPDVHVIVNAAPHLDAPGVARLVADAVAGVVSQQGRQTASLSSPNRATPRPVDAPQSPEKAPVSVPDPIVAQEAPKEAIASPVALSHIPFA